jgi:hypothetical protein
MQMTGAAAATAALSLGTSGNPLALAIVIAITGLLGVTAFASLTPLAPLPTEMDAKAGI